MSGTVIAFVVLALAIGALVGWLLGSRQAAAARQVTENLRLQLDANAGEINRLRAGINREGMTLVPLKIYFNDRGRAKLELALAKGKKLHDKRETEKERDWNRQKSRLLKDH